MTDDVRRDARGEIARRLETARARTLALFDLVPRESDLHASPGFGFRPLAWHLAHTGVFEAYWVLQKVKGEPAPDERYERVFDPIATPREESKELPPRREMEDYLARVRSRVLDFLATADFDSDDRMLRGGYVFRLVLEHERQHQETLAYLLQLLDPAKKSRPATANRVEDEDGVDEENKVDDETARLSSTPEAMRADPAPVESPAGAMIEVPAGEFEMGVGGGSEVNPFGGFAYDNESPAHAVFVPAFKLDRHLITNEEFARFVAEGGYARREFWDEEGWAWREKENWQHPLYWSRDGGGAYSSSWRVREMFADAPLPPRHPVTGVSWYEAEAYARFAGKRLPTEAEWEKAAAWDDENRRRRLFAWGDREPTAGRCNSDFRFWGTTPVGSFPAGASAAGCLDITGNVWEWTSSKFAAYPGFRVFPYPEYSELWFDEDHRVLRGGSWATNSSILRTSFRNFFRRHFRIAFAGLRCADEA